MDLAAFRLKTADKKSSLFGGQSPNSLGQGHFTAGQLRIQSPTDSSEDRAVKVTLKSNAKNRALDSAKDLQLASKTPKSQLRSLLTEIYKRSTNLERLQEQQVTVVAGSRIAEIITAEIAAEQDALNSLVSGDTFKRVVDTVQQVQSSLQSGVSSAGLARALGGSTSLLGDEFLGLVRNGDISNLSSLSRNINAIQSAFADGQLKDIKSYIKNSLDALSGNPYQSITATEESIVQEGGVAPLPELTQISFADSAGELALTLRGYIGADAVQAAMAHLDYDPKHALVLLYDVKEDKEDKEKKEREKKQQSDARVASGLRTD